MAAPPVACSRNGQATSLPSPREAELQELSEYDLKKQSLSLRYRARSGESLDRLLVEAFALVREAGRRKVGMRHFDVQLLGGAAVHHRSDCRDANGRRQDPHRHAAALPGGTRRQGSASGDRQRLPGQARCRLDASAIRSPWHERGRDPKPAAPKRPPQGLRLRRDLRHRQRNGLRLLARSPAQASHRRRPPRPVRRDARR